MADRGRFAILLPSLAFGGAERVALHLADALAARGWQVDMLVMSASGELLQDARGRHRLVDLACDRTWKLPLALAPYLRRERPKALLSSFWKLNLCAALARLIAPSTRLGLWEHSPPSRSAQSPVWLYGPSASVLYRLATRVITVSTGVERDVRNITIGLRDKLVTIFNPIPSTDRMRVATDGPPRLIWVGRMAPPKNPVLMVQAFGALDPALNARLEMVGDGALMPQVRDAVVALGERSSHVQLSGYCDDVAARMAQADLLVLTSDREGLPTVIGEALGAGLGVVATDCGAGVGDMIGHSFGTLAPCGAPIALAEAIGQEWARRPNPQQQRERAAAFAPDIIAARFEAVLGLD